MVTFAAQTYLKAIMRLAGEVIVPYDLNEIKGNCFWIHKHVSDERHKNLSKHFMNCHVSPFPDSNLIISSSVSNNFSRIMQ